MYIGVICVTVIYRCMKSRIILKEIVPKRVSSVLSADEMKPYVQELVTRYGQFKEFTMSVAKPRAVVGVDN